MVTTYSNWRVRDKINICASIDEFCSTEIQAIFVHEINVTKQPDTCSVAYGYERGCGLHLNNVELTFKLVKCSGSAEAGSCNPQQVYKTLGSVRTNSDGVCGIAHEVTDQDRLNYESQISEDVYKVMACITNSDGQPTQSSAISEVTSSITISPSHLECVSNVCTRVTGTGTDTCTTEGSTTECIQSTHYIEYDLSTFPTDFLNLISENIVFISNKMGGYIPLGNNIEYKETIYDSDQKKFKMYFKYTPILSSNISINNLYDHRLVYNLSNGKIETLVSLTDMVTVAAYVTGIIILLIVLILGLLNPWIAAFGIALGVALLYYKLVEIENNGITTGSGPSTPEQEIKAIQEFVDNYLSLTCGESYPSCETNPPTCDANTMRAYLSCINNARLAQCQHAKAKAGLPISDCDVINAEREYEDTCLANGTCTPSEAKDRSTTIIVNPVKEIVTTILEIVTCDPGYAYNKETQTCEKVCNFPFIGQCLDTPIYIGGALLIGYVGLKLISSKK